MKQRRLIESASLKSADLCVLNQQPFYIFGHRSPQQAHAKLCFSHKRKAHFRVAFQSTSWQVCVCSFSPPLLCVAPRTPGSRDRMNHGSAVRVSTRTFKPDYTFHSQHVEMVRCARTLSNYLLFFYPERAQLFLLVLSKNNVRH